MALVSWAIKLYIRKMLTMAGVSPELHALKQNVQPVRRAKVSVVAPIEAGILDLRSQLRQTETWHDWLKTLSKFISLNKVFFVVSTTVVVFVVLIFVYIKSASVENRSYEVTIDAAGSEVKITSEQLAYDELVKLDLSANSNVQVKEFPLISIVNQSGVNGLGAELQLKLEKEGFTITDLDNDFSLEENNTVIVFSPEFADEALELSKHIDGSLLSAYSDISEERTPIVVFVGKDFKNGVE